ncbi:hypothetical protein GQX73_g4254 [Xylaria multiplex]|uniref:LysM domain-containing protein n=1 Tax=Xylaria multiplex TaxID=323545 RepID=A0A7C8IPY6_9PEZI|nr:hypothetical protein GQX73_g4254 [Xylaria multiplex]
MDEFQLYRFYDRPTIVEAWNITDACITALNTTVACDEAVSSLAGQGVDYNYWYIENLTTLCDPVCQDSMKSWGSLVETACGAETIYQSGVEVQAKALSLSFTYNSDIACVRDSDNRWCFLESQEWQGSDYIRWDPGMCFAYEEVPAQCSDPGFDLDEINSDMSGLTNLYDSSLYCSECFLELFRMRMLDPWLTNSNFTQYMLDEFSAIQSFANPLYRYEMCTDRGYKRLFNDIAVYHLFCDPVYWNANNKLEHNGCVDNFRSSYSDSNMPRYQVSTGDARVATRDYSCQFNTTICLPLPCELDTVWDSPSCATLAERYSNSTNRLTELQFLAWNPNIQGSCDGIAIGQRVCKGAPGGTFPSPVATITAPAATGTGVYYSTATPAHPTQSGSIPDCGRYYLVASGDDCYTVDIQFSITFDQLREYNTYLDEQCSNLWLDYDVCVARVTQPKTSTDGTCGVGVTSVVHRMETVETGQNIVVLAVMARRQPMVLAARITAGPRVPTHFLAIAVAFMDSVVLVRTFAALGTATREIARRTTAAHQLTGIQYWGSSAAKWWGMSGPGSESQTSAFYSPSALFPQVMSPAHYLRLVSLLVLVIAIIVSVIIHQHTSEADQAATRNIHLHEMDDGGHLVTLANPAREDGTLDHERCAKLHNRLVEHAWVVDGRVLDDLERRSFFEHYGDEANDIVDRLDPSVVAFLKSIIVPEDPPPFFFWVEGIAPPAEIFSAQEMFQDDEEAEPGRFLTLYTTNLGLGEHSLGLIYDQKLHRATMALGVEDVDFVKPVEEHDELWHPLEAVLSNWIYMFGPWTWHPYSEPQVASTVAAFERLVTTIEGRMPVESYLRPAEGPLLSNEQLDAASVPGDCFIRSFATRARKPRFRMIAPGLEVPHDSTTFVNNQKFTVMDVSSEYGIIIPPVLLFASSEHATVNLAAPSQYVSFNPFLREFQDMQGNGPAIAGLYSESVERFSVDNAEEGFRLLLPFRFRGSDSEEGPAAKKSDGSVVTEGSVAELFQHGFKPFGGEWWRAQRLESLFDHWRWLIEKGIWTVGDGGVQGDIHLFRDTDTRSSEYRIKPSW